MSVRFKSGVESRPNLSKQADFEQSYHSIDWWLVAIVLSLLCLGLIMVLSASGVIAEKLTEDKYYFFKKQCIFAVLSVFVLCVAIYIPRAFLNKIHYVVLALAFASLIITLSPLGVRVNGAQRWVSIAGISLQPMEFVKIALIFYLSYFFATKQDIIKTFSKGVVPPFAITCMLALLLLFQPDFGGAAVLAIILFFMCLTSGTKLIYLLFALGLGVAGALLLIIQSPYRARRLTAFLDPFKDALDSGYQLVQSMYALGSGGFFGVGMGASHQKMLYLPEAHNDFIMAVIGEELGFLGVSVVMLLILLMLVRCYKITMGQNDLRDKFMSFGLTLVIGLGAVLNLAVVFGMAPPKGVPMPFLSYGGSSLLASMLCIGLLLNYSRTGNKT